MVGSTRKKRISTRYNDKGSNGLAGEHAVHRGRNPVGEGGEGRICIKKIGKVPSQNRSEKSHTKRIGSAMIGRRGPRGEETKPGKKYLPPGKFQPHKHAREKPGATCEFQRGAGRNKTARRKEGGLPVAGYNPSATPEPRTSVMQRRQTKLHP